MTHSPSDRSLNDCNTDVECSQSIMAHPTDEIPTSGEASCVQVSDDFLIVAQNPQQSIVPTETGTAVALSSEASPLSSLSIEHVENHDDQQLAQSSGTAPPDSHPIDENDQPTIANVRQPEETDIGQCILAPPIITPSKKSQFKDQKKKLKSEMKLHLQLAYAIEEESRNTNQDDFKISEDSTEFIHHGKRIPIHIQQLHSTSKIDGGAFGQVYMVDIKGPPEIHMAVKRVAPSNMNEIKILERINTNRCPYIVEYYCSMFDRAESNLCICMERMDMSVKNFYKTMHSLGEVPSDILDRLLRRFLHDIVAALYHLEGQEVIHQDIKPANILVNKTGMFKLCDFGISHTFSELQTNLEGVGGTAYYMPPERELTIRDDMWALGISLLEIIIGQNPFADIEPDAVPFITAHWTPILPTTISANMQGLILQLLEKDPRDRPISYLDILNMLSIWNVFDTTSNEDLDRFIGYIIEIGN